MGYAFYTHLIVLVVYLLDISVVIGTRYTGHQASENHGVPTESPTPVPQTQASTTTVETTTLGFGPVSTTTTSESLDINQRCNFSPCRRIYHGNRVDKCNIYLEKRDFINAWCDDSSGKAMCHCPEGYFNSVFLTDYVVCLRIFGPFERDSDKHVFSTIRICLLHSNFSRPFLLKIVNRPVNSEELGVISQTQVDHINSLTTTPDPVTVPSCNQKINLTNPRFSNGHLNIHNAIKALDGVIAEENLAHSAGSGEYFYVDTSVRTTVQDVGYLKIYPRQKLYFKRYANLTVDFELKTGQKLSLFSPSELTPDYVEDHQADGLDFFLPEPEQGLENLEINLIIVGNPDFGIQISEIELYANC